MSSDFKSERTSDSISRISLKIPMDGINFKDFLQLIGEQGLLLSCVVLVAPFLFPVSVPGSSIPFGLAIILINIGIISNRHPFIPDRIMKYSVSQENMLTILNGMKRVLLFLEKFIRPRFTLFQKPLMDYFNSVVMILCAFLLMLPLPVPLTDFLPAYGILFMALGSLENDGYMIVAGYVIATVTAIYFLLIALLGISGINAILSFFGLQL
jgi:hypothetical protein